jgi:DNA-binding transcriptional LysR family regulator
MLGFRKTDGKTIQMKLQQLRYFVAVYEEGSFSAGAQRVNATQSGLSMQVRDLEERYGVTLLTRSNSGATPTDAGKRVYKHAVKVLRAVSEAEEELGRLKGQVMGEVHIGLMPTFTGSVLPSVLQRFTEEFPLVKASIHEAYSANLSEMTAKSQLDFSIVPAFDETPSLRAESVGTDREYLVYAARPDRLNRAPVRLSEMGPLKLVLPSRANARRRRIDTYIMENGIEVTEILELDAMLGTLELVARSDWITILPSILCSADADGATRHVRPIIDPVLTVTYIRIEPVARGLSDAARAFDALLCSELEAALQWDDTLAIS